ncbi:signal peptidase I [Clostridium bornimense]|uniref:signal peptidase I n=2 Tax=Clostridium TaxID=1485 RepID=UPI001C11843D|nr:signal peptidase I [Clostridium bornimense]MBU5316110.1 signal peptidase I [Clostridium bornimense]
MKKFFRGLGNTIFTLIIILMVIGLVGNLSAKSDKVYNIVKYRTYIIVSPSMKPAINPGDLIFVRKVDVDKIKEGDIITFKNEDMVATHRVVKVDKNTITTKGDSNNTEDYPTDKKEIIGEFSFAIPKIGYVFAFATSLIGMVTIGCVIIFIFIYDFIFKENKKSKNN